MFRKIRENEYVKKFIEIWAIPRYRSLIILGLYIIFFAFVIAFIKSGRSVSQNATNNTNKVDAMTAYREMNSYRYHAVIKNESEKILTGKVHEYKQLINFNDNNYYYNNVYLYKREENIYRLTKEKLLDFEIWRMTPVFVNNLIEKGTFVSKTEYSNGGIAHTYSVNVSDFISLYFGEKSEADEIINITIHQRDEKVYKVELELTSIYKQQQFSNSYDYIVVIEYDMINEITPIVVNVESSD